MLSTTVRRYLTCPHVQPRMFVLPDTVQTAVASRPYRYSWDQGRIGFHCVTAFFGCSLGSFLSYCSLPCRQYSLVLNAAAHRPSTRHGQVSTALTHPYIVQRPLRRLSPTRRAGLRPPCRLPPLPLLLPQWRITPSPAHTTIPSQPRHGRATTTSPAVGPSLLGRRARAGRAAGHR